MLNKNEKLKIIVGSEGNRIPVKDSLDDKNLNYTGSCSGSGATSVFKNKKPKFIISGINPHASENSIFGNHEEKILIPQIKKTQKKQIKITGPFSADSMLNNINLKKYDCFIFCYHDQALVAYKYISKNRGINFTGGLSILRTSPDHGTAYNLVGKKNVENKSLLNCFNFLKRNNVSS